MILKKLVTVKAFSNFYILIIRNLSLLLMRLKKPYNSFNCLTIVQNDFFLTIVQNDFLNGFGSL